MKILMFVVLGLLVLGMVAYVIMAIKSQKMPDRLTSGEGLQNNMLFPCPESPNCVCSEAHTTGDKQHFIAPIQGDIHIFEQLKAEMKKQGASIKQAQAGYVHATFTTAVFHYVDDVELRFDAETNMIHLRSASRIGRSDFGENRKRMMQLQAHLVVK